MPHKPYFSIIVPTRERRRTLVATLRSILSESHLSYEVIVSDNASSDGTAQAVQSFDDDRIKYFNTQTRLSMHENWNFALSKARGEFVIVIGDDDGLVPGALGDIAALIESTNSKAVSWNKVDYCWPDYPRPELCNRLSIPLDNNLFQVNAAAAVRDVTRFVLPYNRTPTLYNSAVSMDVIRACLLRDGKFFKSASPDVYSGIALLSKLDSYLYSSRPFSINGASAASNGTAFVNDTDQSPYDMFVRELGTEYQYLFGRIAGSVNSELLEAVLQANIHHFAGRLKVAKRMAIFRMCTDLAAIGGVRQEEGMHAVALAAKRHGLSGTFSIAQFLSRPAPRRQMASELLNSRNELMIDASKFGVSDVFEASKFAGALLGPYARPSQMLQYSLTRRLASVVRRKLLPPKLNGNLAVI